MHAMWTISILLSQCVCKLISLSSTVTGACITAKGAALNPAYPVYITYYYSSSEERIWKLTEKHMLQKMTPQFSTNMADSLCNAWAHVNITSFTISNWSGWGAGCKGCTQEKHIAGIFLAEALAGYMRRSVRYQRWRRRQLCSQLKGQPSTLVVDLGQKI